MKKLLLSLAALTAVISLSPAQTASAAAPVDPAFAETKKTVVTTIQEILEKSAYVPGVDFSKFETFLKEAMPNIDKAANDGEFSNAIEGALRKFGFSHITLHTPQMVNARRDASTVGIGVRISPQQDGILIIGLVPDAPAQAAGIEVGDLMIEADGKKLDGPGQIAGKEGTPVVIKVKKANGSIKEYTIIRRKFSTVRPEELNWIDGETAVLRVYTFDLSYNRERMESLVKEAAKAKNLLIDLRGNGGGAVLNMNHMLGMFLPDRTPIGAMVDKQMFDQWVNDQKGKATDYRGLVNWTDRKTKIYQNRRVTWKGNLAVLVDQGSGSASEISAAALRDVLKCPIIGMKSAGAVLVSYIRPIPGTSYALQYPVQDYVTLNGIRLEGNGVQPNLEIKNMTPFLKQGEVDPAWIAARDYLKKWPATR